MPLNRRHPDRLHLCVFTTNCESTRRKAVGSRQLCIVPEDNEIDRLDVECYSGRKAIDSSVSCIVSNVLRLIMVLITAAYGALAILGSGGFRAFFTHTALTALFVVPPAISVVALFGGGNLSSGGSRQPVGYRCLCGDRVAGRLTACAH